MKIKETLIHLLGGHTLEEYNDMRKTATEALSGWQNDITNERFLPKILVALGIYPSVSEIRRNKPDLMVTLSAKDFISKLKVAKKRYLWIAIGE